MSVLVFSRAGVAQSLVDQGIDGRVPIVRIVHIQALIETIPVNNFPNLLGGGKQDYLVLDDHVVILSLTKMHQGWLASKNLGNRGLCSCQAFCLG
jgi:hypothetical protein